MLNIKTDGQIAYEHSPPTGGGLRTLRRHAVAKVAVRNHNPLTPNMNRGTQPATSTMTMNPIQAEQPIVRTLRKLTPKVELPSASALAEFGETEMERLRKLSTEVLEVVLHPSFRYKDAEQRYAASGFIPTVTFRPALPEFDEEGELVARRQLPKTLSREEEADLFLRFNYYRFRMYEILRANRGKRLTIGTCRELLRWDARAAALRAVIVEQNLGLVPTMIERSRKVGADFSELISEGHLALLRSVDKFDCSRGFKFSTYACRAIITGMSRAVGLLSRYRSVFPTEFDPDLQAGDQIETKRADALDDCIEELQAILGDNRADLSPVEWKVLAERFGVYPEKRSGPISPQKTLRQVADVFGVTKERVRQIQNKALEKLRQALDDKVFPKNSAQAS